MARKRRKRPRLSLSSSDRVTIRSINRSDIEATFSGLERFIKRAAWIGKANRYSRDTIKRIKSDIKSGGVRSPRQLSQYVVASTVLHCADGWSYLGKAMGCLLLGDPHRSRHLAYYAELRAALSLLASEGVGLFQDQHFAIDAPNSVVRLQISKTTHQAVWNCLEGWAKL
jgi:hypothetical protein